MKKPIFVFFIELKKQLQLFQSVFLGEGKTVPVPPVRFCARFQRFTVPTVHRLFDFLRFGSTVPVRFQNLTDYSKLTFQIPDDEMFAIKGTDGFCNLCARNPIHAVLPIKWHWLRVCGSDR